MNFGPDHGSRSSRSRKGIGSGKQSRPYHYNPSSGYLRNENEMIWRQLPTKKAVTLLKVGVSSDVIVRHRFLIFGLDEKVEGPSRVHVNE